ncbi:hypothetical protein VJ918_09525 [Adlercreutzia sp. R21]|uniref:hypothetical protein n=1 Tax=Adlercreutzia wanghongyangiae TaxID=3111451 RepID=UPI002DB593A8|nr:hypothetical protein [Adlercreutzia sp. R21]MEC4185046.1 hypothetical protein [Adlercreutzia sp. R21]
MVGFKDKLSSSLNNLKDHVTSEEFANSMTEHAQSFLTTAKNDLPDIVEEIQVSRAFGISGTTVMKRRVRDWQLQQLASIAEEALSGAASQADSQTARTSALDAVDTSLQNSASGIEFEKVGAITSFDPDDPWADMQFDDDADTPPDNPLDCISFRR